MKLVKMNLFIACFLSTILSCFSCGEDYDSVMADFSFLNVDKAKMYFDNEGEEKSFAVLSASMDFSVSMSEGTNAWASYRIDKKNVIVKVEKNLSNEVRTGVITIQSEGKTSQVKIQQGFTRILAGYVYQSYEGLPDVSKLTHVNYAFGHINGSYNGLEIDNIEKFRQIIAMKKQYPNLKVILSIGGATQLDTNNFFHMTNEASNRSAFINSCIKAMKEYGFDGFDMDWETPTSQKERENFNALMKEFRQAVGADVLLTVASPAHHIEFDFKTLDNYIDFVNVMGYDIDIPPYHQSGLYRSEMTNKCSIEEGMKAHMESGMPAYKLVMGVPFYGLAIDQIDSKDYRFVDYRAMDQFKSEKNATEAWDDKACVPYIKDAQGNFICTFDNIRSIGIKCQYIKDQKYLGMMFWHYDADTEDGVLRNAAAEGLK